jgi:uncharacterized tellurite resistance protein B-like protein
MNRNYHLGLLCLTHLLISADGIVDEPETDALRLMRDNEKIPDDLYKEFATIIAEKNEREVFEAGIDFLNRCTNDEKLKVFVLLYKLSEVDGRVHVKEIRLLLYSIKLTHIDFSDVVSQALAAPPLL